MQGKRRKKKSRENLSSFWGKRKSELFLTLLQRIRVQNVFMTAGHIVATSAVRRSEDRMPGQCIHSSTLGRNLMSVTCAEQPSGNAFF